VLKKLLGLFAAFCIFFNCLNLNAFALEAAAAPSDSAASAAAANKTESPSASVPAANSAAQNVTLQTLSAADAGQSAAGKTSSGQVASSALSAAQNSSAQNTSAQQTSSSGQAQTSSAEQKSNTADYSVQSKTAADSAASSDEGEKDEEYYAEVKKKEDAAAAQAKKTDEQSSVSAMKDGSNFKLFEPKEFDFMTEGGPLLPLPDVEADETHDEYYQYSRRYLENAIAQVQGGVDLQKRGIEYLEILNPSLMLPIYGTTISLTGRKTFGIKYTSKKYDQKGTVDNKDESGVDFDQQMQMKVQGKISNRIFVDVDYDDQRTDEQNISVSYRGQPDEVVQSADFGDINLSLPGSEFVSYNKQVFGAKMHLKYGGANLMLIGSQSKGENKTKQFKGDSQQQTVNIKDSAYTRRTYYDLTFGGDSRWTYSIVSGSDKVYIDDHTTKGYQEALKVQDMKVQSSVYPTTGGTAGFRVLTRGVDYVIDYNKNLIRFTSALNDTDVVAIDYKNSNGQSLSDAAYGGMPKIIKTAGDRAIADTDEIGYQLEVKRFYNIGSTQITKDNGQGNFILKLLESDGSTVCKSGDTRLYCQNTVDYTRGVFEIGGKFDDASLYNATPVSTTNRYFLVQFNSTVKTYYLEPDIVVQSETVKVNGATMNRNKDYYVDYSSGYITFYNEDLIGSGSVIDVSYQVSSGTNKDSALMGGRFNYDFTDKISIGSTVLNESGTKPKRVPNVGSLTNSLTTTEADVKANDLQIADGVKLSLGAEAAHSKKDQNLFGYALVDSMDDTKEYVKASNVYSDWRIGSNPTPAGSATQGTSFLDAVKWDSQSVPLIEINPNTAANKNDSQNVLVINYDFSIAEDKGYPNNDEISLIYPISNSGADFTAKTLMEFSMLGELNGPDINISFGSFDEKSDNYDYLPSGFTESQVYPTCSKYYGSATSRNVPKTEDLNCSGALTSSQDSGWLFVNPDDTYQRYNPFKDNKYNKESQPNGRIDSQDLNDNGILDSWDSSSGDNFGFAASSPNGTDGDSGALIIDPTQTGLSGNTINFEGWKQFSRQVSFTDSTKWSAIKQVRITLRKSAFGHDKGTIKIANLSVSGNTWKPVEDTYKNVVSTYGINNIDNSDYKPIFNDTGDGGQVFHTLYGSVNDLKNDQNNIEEQSLALKYDFSKDTTVKDFNVQRSFSSMDFSQHKEFRFLLYNNNTAVDPDTKFYIRIQADDNNYSEIEIPLDFKSAWHLYSLKMIDTDGDNIPNRWENNSSYDANVTNEGSVNFKKITSIKVGMRTTNAAAAGEVWLDDIFLAGSVVLEGNAYMGQAKVDVENWLEASGKVKYMDSNFQTPVTTATNQKYTEQNYALKFKRFKNLPINATYYKSDTVTPDVLNSTTNSISVLDQGEVTKDKGTVSAEYIDPYFPHISAGYAFEDADYQKLQRNDNKQTYSLGVDYSPKSSDAFIKSLNATTSLVNNKIDYSDEVAIADSASYYNTDEQTKNYGFKLSLQPWDGASLVPSYSLAMVNEERRSYDDSALIFKDRRYPKSALQQVGVTSAMRINKWLAPTASYSIKTTETNNLSATSYTSTAADNSQTYNFDVGDIKSIDRSSEGSVGLNLNGREIFEDSKFMSGLAVSGSYKLQDGDTWENVDSSYNSLDQIWIRNSLGAKAPYTYRSNLILRDTYASTLRWTPFGAYSIDGRLAPLKKLTVSNNYSKAYQTTEDSGSLYKTETTTLPDLILNMDELEKFVADDNPYVNNVNTKLKYSVTDNNIIDSQDKTTTAYGGDLRFMLLNYFDTTFTYSEQKLFQVDTTADAPLQNYLRKDFSGQTAFTYAGLRFNPKVTYIYDRKTEENDVLTSRVEEIIPSLGIKADFNLPYGIHLPFITRQYLFTNRIIWNTTLSYSRRRSFTVSENRDLYDATTSVDYEVSKNIRVTLSAAYERFKHIYLPEESYTSYTVGSLLTIQF